MGYQSGLVIADLTTVAHRSKLLINDIKTDHSLYMKNFESKWSKNINLRSKTNYILDESAK